MEQQGLWETLRGVEGELEATFDEHMEVMGDEGYTEEREFLLARASYLSKRLDNQMKRGH